MTPAASIRLGGSQKVTIDLPSLIGEQLATTTRPPTRGLCN